MTDLSKDLRGRLAADFHVSTPQVVADRELSADGTEKFLLELADGRRIESVFIPDTPGMTLCVSTQVGCAMRLRLLPDRQDGDRPQPDRRRDRRSGASARQPRATCSSSASTSC